MASVFGDTTLRRKNGETVPAADALKGKTVAVLFSAHWCPPCRAFTPALKDFYDELRKENAAFEVVFVSLDRSMGDMMNYIAEAHGDWLHLQFQSPLIQKLSTQFGVSGIPTLVILRPDGTVVTKNGRSDVESKAPSAVLEGWQK